MIQVYFPKHLEDLNQYLIDLIKQNKSVGPDPGMAASLTECEGQCTASCDLLSCSKHAPCPNVCAGHGIFHISDPAVDARPAGSCASTLELRGVRVQGRRVEGPPFAWDERYPALVHCHGAWVLTTRNYQFDVPNDLQGSFHNNGVAINARVLQGIRWSQNATITAKGRSSLPKYMAHNAAGICLAQALSGLPTSSSTT